MIDSSIKSELDERTSEPMKWQQVLFLQVRDINRAMNEQNPGFPSSVEIFNSDLVYFRDEKYDKDIADMEKSIKATIQKNRRPDGNVPPDKFKGIEWSRAKTLFEINLKLIGRAGFYPEQQAEWKE